MDEPMTLKPTEGRTPEEVMDTPIRRLCRLEHECELCGGQHSPQFYISIEAGNLEEYQEGIEKLMRESNVLRTLARKAATMMHEQRGDLAALTRRVMENGPYRVAPTISVTMLDESDYTCEACGNTFETIHKLRDHNGAVDCRPQPPASVTTPHHDLWTEWSG